jgi:hypothetical protein
VLDTVTADKLHRGHAIIEQVHADLKNSALAHLPSGRFAANSAWLVLAAMAFNLTRAAASITGKSLAKTSTATIRRTLITVPARIASSARRLTPASAPVLVLVNRVEPTLHPHRETKTAGHLICTRVCQGRRARRRPGPSSWAPPLWVRSLWVVASVSVSTRGQL